MVDELILKIKENKKYDDILFSLKEKRRQLLGQINLTDYVRLLSNNISSLMVIFKDKNCNNKKIVKNISNTLTSLDKRLTGYGDYYNTNIEYEELEQFNLNLITLINFTEEFIPFDKNMFIKNIKNYSLSLFSLETCISRCLINTFKSYNIIYISFPNSTRKDPYSFYILDKVDKNKNRHWVQQCRLEDFVNDFIINILPYCIQLFRSIYKDIFNDNEYRYNYIYQSEITQYDCEQLIQNIILLSKPVKLRDIFQTIIIEKATFSMTKDDILNFTADDILQKKRLVHIKDEEEEIYNNIKQLFDSIEPKHIENFLKKK